VAATCVDANIAATAAIVRGRSAVPWLNELGLPARLVATSGQVVRLGGWPAPIADPSTGPLAATA
jgi:thiamine biosynthesis lipoprotein